MAVADLRAVVSGADGVAWATTGGLCPSAKSVAAACCGTSQQPAATPMSTGSTQAAATSAIPSRRRRDRVAFGLRRCEPRRAGGHPSAPTPSAVLTASIVRCLPIILACTTRARSSLAPG